MSCAEIFTDGSCHTQYGIGAWVAIIFINEEKILISGIITGTTHNRMELVAVIKGIEYIQLMYPAETQMKIVSDSQYVIGLRERKEKLVAANFVNKKGNALNNSDLVIIFFDHYSTLKIELIKIKAHQKKNGITNYNIEADKLARAMVRQEVRELENKFIERLGSII